jgi:hypothetical protein
MLIGANRPSPNRKGEIISCVACREWSGEEFRLLSGMLSPGTIESRTIAHGWQLACDRHGFSLTKNEDAVLATDNWFTLPRAPLRVWG